MSTETPASWNAVIPNELSSSMPRRDAAACCSGVSPPLRSYASCTGMPAASRSTPVGVPSSGSSSVTPEVGMLSAVMPASFRARVLAQRLWRESSMSATGRPPAASSSRRRVAVFASVGSRVVATAPPTIQASSGMVCAFSRTRSRISSSVREGASDSSKSSVRPASAWWLCTSTKPG